MTTNTSKLAPTELDFDLIKAELKQYFNSQDEFSEYNFEGSALNVLMDILAYNTHMNSYMANMSTNEMFLDSAVIRQSVISKSKEIGYTSRSVRSPKATVDIALTGVAGTPPYITMDAGTQFQNQHDIVFSTKEDILLYPSTTSSTRYEIDNINIYEGNFNTFSYTVDNINVNQKFIIPSVDVDMSTLRVIVKPDKNSNTVDEFTLNNDLNRLDPNSAVYFFHETAEGYYEVTFGDGILGKELINGNYITFSYIISNEKAAGNDITDFIPYQRIAGISGNNIFITTVEPSYGGDEKESIESIKKLAPRMFQSQRRAVTIEDYETFLLQDYPWIDTINSWGGEYNDPPIYGKVFFAIKPKHTEFISNTLKEEIKNDLIKNYNVVTIIPEIIDPDYVYMNTEHDVYYTPSKTTLSKSQLTIIVNDVVYQYFSDTTEKFKMDFKFSPLITKVDSSDESITNSLGDIIIHKRIFPIINTEQTFTLNFNNGLSKNTIESSSFNVIDNNIDDLEHEAVIMDNGSGILQLINRLDSTIINSNIGSVDYNTGKITFTIFTYSVPLDTLDIRIYAQPELKDVVSGYNQIIIPDESALNNDYNRKQGVVIRIHGSEG